MTGGSSTERRVKDIEGASHRLMPAGMAAALGTSITYGSQGWYLPEHEMILSIGSYGQVGFSDLESGLSVVFMQDWEDNAVVEKLVDTVARALFVIEQLGSQ